MDKAALSRYANLLRQCGKRRDLCQARQLHLKLRNTNLFSDSCLEEFVIEMYGYCGSVDDAWLAFRQIKQPGISTWNRMIMALGRSGQLDDARSLFDRMPGRDLVSWNSILTSYSQSSEVESTYRVFFLMPGWDGFSWNSMLAAIAQTSKVEEAEEFFHSLPVREMISWTSMLHACARCSNLSKVESLFSRMPSWDIVCWNALIAAFAHAGDVPSAWLAFAQMPARSSVTWTNVLQAFSFASQPDSAAVVFHRMPLWSSAAWNLMIQCQSAEESVLLLGQMPRREELSWSAVILGCCRRLELELALAALARMPRWDAVVCNTVMAALVSAGKVAEAEEMFHAAIPARDVVTWNVLISSVCDDARRAAAVFERMPRHDIVSVNSMVHVYALGGDTGNADRLLQAMDCFSLTATNSIIKAHGLRGQVENARKLFDAMPRRDSVSWNSIVTAYARVGAAGEAKRLFDAFSGAARDAISWCAMLQAYGASDACELHLAEDCFAKMPCTSLASWNTMLQAYALRGQMQQAEELFSCMPSRDLICWNGLASARLLNGQLKSAASVVSSMDLEGVKPDAVGYVIALDACGKSSDLAQGRLLHAALAEDDELRNDYKVATAVLTMYSKCAAVDEAVSTFASMNTRCRVSWTAMVAALAENGFNSLALAAFREMELSGVAPDFVSFIHILSACSHVGSVEMGRHCFASMVGDYGIQPGVDHYACLVDSLSRAGSLVDACQLMDASPFAPESVSRMALLSACRAQPQSSTSIAEFHPREACDGALYVAVAGLFQDAAASSTNKVIA